MWPVSELVSRDMRSFESNHFERSRKTPYLPYICSYCDLKAWFSNVDDKLTQLISTVDKHKNKMHSQSAHDNNSGVDTADDENITAFIRENLLKFDRRTDVCIFNLQQGNDDLRNFLKLCIKQLGIREHELFWDTLSAERFGDIASVLKPRSILVLHLRWN